MDRGLGFNKNLHGLRGLLALGVLVGHCDVADLSSVSVWFFFVLSGYLLASIYRDGMRLDQLGAYALRRVARLVPLYATVLVIIAVVPVAIWQGLTPKEAWKFDAIAGSLLQHLTFLRANLHFWTLAQEMAAYVLIAALMLARGRIGIVPFIALCGALAVASSMFISIPMASDDQVRPFYALHFIVGVVAAMIPLGRPKGWASAIALAILSALFAAGLYGNFIAEAYGVSHWHHLVPAPLWGLIGGIVVLGLAHGTNVLDRLGFFGTVSYGIYVFHFLVILILAHSRMTPVQSLGAVGAITIVLAWLSWRVIEAPCIAFAHRVTRRARPDTVMAAAE